MKSFLITYDADKATDAQQLLDVLNGFDVCLQAPNSTMVIQSCLSAEGIAKYLLPYLSDNSALFVMEISGDVFWDSSDDAVKSWEASRLKK